METFCKQLALYFIVLAERLYHKVWEIKGLTQSRCKWTIDVRGYIYWVPQKGTRQEASQGFHQWSGESHVTRNKKMCLPMGQVNTNWKSRLGKHNKKSAKIYLSSEKCSFLNL